MSLQVVYSTSVLHSYLVQGHENNAWQDPKEGLMNLSRVLSQDRIVRLEQMAGSIRKALLRAQGI
jgi:hypothetical protein